jgi:hypothetical protein
MVTIFPTPPQFSQLASLPNRSFFLPVFRSQGRPLRRHVHLVLSTFLPSPNPRPTLPLCPAMRARPSAEILSPVAPDAARLLLTDDFPPNSLIAARTVSTCCLAASFCPRNFDSSARSDSGWYASQGVRLYRLRIKGVGGG